MIEIIQETGNHWKLLLGKVKHIFSFSGKISYSFLKTSKTKQKHSPAQVSSDSQIFIILLLQSVLEFYITYIHHSSEKCTSGCLILSFQF